MVARRSAEVLTDSLNYSEKNVPPGVGSDAGRLRHTAAHPTRSSRRHVPAPLWSAAKLGVQSQPSNLQGPVRVFSAGVRGVSGVGQAFGIGVAALRGRVGHSSAKSECSAARFTR
jgi:hypothetical protein